MEMRVIFSVLIFVLLAGRFAYAEDSWDSFADNESVVNNSSYSSDSGLSENNLTSDDDYNGASTTQTSSNSGEASFKYTANFYIALGIGAFGLLILIILILSFFLHPRNKWKR